MSLQSEIIDITAGLSKKTSYIFANIYEANFQLDTLLQEAVYPVHICLPYKVIDKTSTGGIQRSVASLEGFFLDKIPSETLEYKTGEVELSAVEPMRNLAREFFHKLEESDSADLTDEIVDEITKNYLPTYHSFDASLHGIHYLCDFPVNENITGCIE